MRQLILTVCMLVAALLMAACTQKQKNQTDGKSVEKILVLYYSQTETTAAVAEELRKTLGADVERIEATEPYTGDYQQTIDRCREEVENDIAPTINPLHVNLADYDVIFLGYPIWFSTYPRPVMALLDSYDLAGKKVVPFYTFGKGRPDTSVKDLRQALPQTEITEAYSVLNTRLNAIHYEVNRFLILNGFVKGGLEPIDDYSNQNPVTLEERDILETACSGYQFPSGTVMTVGSRKTSYGTDYKYNLRGATPDGDDTSYTVYVTVGNAPNSKPEFTKVERE